MMQHYLRRPHILAALSALFVVAATVVGQERDSKADLRVERGTLTKYITTAGELSARENLTVFAPDAWHSRSCVISYLATDGVEVKPGDMLAEFDLSELDTTRLQLEADKEEARIAVAQKEADIDGRRQDALLNLSTAEMNYKVAQLRVGIDPSLLPRSDYEKYQLDFNKAKLDLDKA